jgi:hypothetical protein
VRKERLVRSHLRIRRPTAAARTRIRTPVADMKLAQGASPVVQLRKHKTPYFKGARKMSLQEFNTWVTREARREAQSVGPAFDMEMLDSTPEEIHRRLPPSEKWREHIDAKHHQHGREVYKQGLHRGGQNKEPTYNERMMQADLAIGQTFGRKFTAEDYVAIRKKVAPDGGEFGAMLRKGVASKLEFPDLIDRRKDVENPLVDISHTREAVRIGLKKTDDPLGDVQRILDDHYRDIGGTYDPDEKLKIIARTHRDLENLHPYVDYNTRTNRLVLNRLLAEQRQPMTLLHDPLSVHIRSPEGWADQIRDGQKAWADQAQRTTREGSAEQWSNFGKLRRWGPQLSAEQHLRLLEERS